MEAIDLFSKNISYNAIDDQNIMSLIALVRQGIKFPVFVNFMEKSPFDLAEWSGFLHISERTMQRYKKEERTFDALQSEKILEIALLYKKGIEVFGNTINFNTWLNTLNLALGKIKPKELFDSSFGISLLKDELTRIEHGVLA
jgi:putative toxin-antitoxin system antitoxin component (TIGR02293 family)